MAASDGTHRTTVLPADRAAVVCCARLHSQLFDDEQAEELT